MVVPSVAMFTSEFYTGRHAGCYTYNLYKLGHKCVTDIQK